MPDDWNQDCAVRGVPCRRCWGAPFALQHFGCTNRGIDPHPYDPSEDPPLPKGWTDGSDISTMHVTEIAEWPSQRLSEIDFTLSDDIKAKIVHVSIELTDEEREKFDALRRDYFKR